MLSQNLLAHGLTHSLPPYFIAAQGYPSFSLKVISTFWKQRYIVQVISLAVEGNPTVSVRVNPVVDAVGIYSTVFAIFFRM